MRILLINLLCITSLLVAVPVEDDVQFENDNILTPEQEDELKDNGRLHTFINFFFFHSQFFPHPEG
jgi:hypothetical protein